MFSVYIKNIDYIKQMYSMHESAKKITDDDKKRYYAQISAYEQKRISFSDENFKQAGIDYVKEIFKPDTPKNPTIESIFITLIDVYTRDIWIETDGYNQKIGGGNFRAEIKNIISDIYEKNEDLRDILQEIISQKHAAFMDVIDRSFRSSCSRTPYWNSFAYEKRNSACATDREFIKKKLIDCYQPISTLGL